MMKTRPMRIALPKGRLMADALKLWERIGSGIAEGEANTRRLIIPSSVA